MQKFLHADNDDSDQTAQLRRPIRVFIRRTCQKDVSTRFGSLVLKVISINVIHYTLIYVET